MPMNGAVRGNYGELFHQYCPEEASSKYSLIVFDDEKKAFIPLTEYYHHQITRIGENSVIAYLNVLEPFFYWLKHKSQYQGRIVEWNDEPEAVQVAVRDK